MSVPKDRVSFGAHAFPFTGLRRPDDELAVLPSLPLRVRATGNEWLTPFDAVLDTGSTRTVLPLEWAAHRRHRRGRPLRRLRGRRALYTCIPRCPGCPTDGGPNFFNTNRY
jgi:hypothetical protein